MKKIKKLKGFTLVELIVVVAIIAILAAAVTLEVVSNEVKARDSRRMADMKTVWNAVQQYKNDNNEKIPNQATTGNSFAALVDSKCSASAGTSTYNQTNCISFTSAISQYLSPLPTDPINDNSYYYSYYNIVNSSGVRDFYTTFAKLEDPNSGANIQNKCVAYYGGNAISTYVSKFTTSGSQFSQCQ